MTTQNTILEVKNLKKYYPIRKGFLKRVVNEVKAVDEVSLSIQFGETLKSIRDYLPQSG